MVIDVHAHLYPRAFMEALGAHGPSHGVSLTADTPPFLCFEGIRYWRSRTGGTVADTYGNVYVGFNDFNRMQFSPLRFDTPDGGWPSSGSRLRANLVLNQSPYVWFSTETSGAWNVGGNWNYGTSTTPTSPGITDTWGTYISAYAPKSGAVIRWTVAPWSESEMPSADYHCQSRGQNDWNTPGAIN